MTDFYTWSRKLAVFLLLAVVQPCFGQILNDRDCNIAKPRLVLVTRNPCPPCRVAKTLLESMSGEMEAFERTEWDIDRDRSKIAALGIGRITGAPVLILLDGHGNAVQWVSQIDAEHVRELIREVPVEPFQPTVLDSFAELIEPLEKMQTALRLFGASRVITFDIATEYKQGLYNGTFTYGSCEYQLKGFGKYVGIDFQRTNNGKFHIVQAATNLGNGVAASTNLGAQRIRVSPTFRFVNEIQCGMIICHEFLHLANANHHSQDSGLMGPNGGYLLLPSDYPWMNRYVWKSALRPTQEPNWFKSYLSRNAVLGGDEMFPLMNQQRAK